MEPLIDGIPAFRRMEQAIVSARKTVHLSAWIFDPATPLKEPAAKKAGDTWGDLLIHAAARGVRVRLLLSVLDAVIKPDEHRAAWRAARRLWDRAAKLPEDRRTHLQIVCSLHDATAKAGIQEKVRPRFQKVLDGLNAYRKQNGAAAALRRFADMPGLWRNVRWNEERSRFVTVPAADLVIRPASHHQKTCIVDARVAFCGGLDIAKGRLDTPAHGGMLWHDVACEVDGDAAADIERNFIERWNDELEGHLEFVDEANALRRGVSISGITPTEVRVPPDGVGVGMGTSAVQVLRTTSTNSWTSQIPTVLRRDIEEAHLQAIKRARQYIYLENQYVREPAILEWIRGCESFETVQLIVVLPVAPEEAASGEIDEVTAHGLFLQHQVLTELRVLLGDRLGIYSMVQRKRSPSPRRLTSAHGSTQIYVHSKCLLVDDRFAIIGSANATGRSFRVDSELAIGWYDPLQVEAFRKRLWNELLGSPAGIDKWPLGGVVREWESIATRNDAARPAEREGFIVHHDFNRPRLRGRRLPLLPDEFAALPAAETPSDMLA